MCRGLGKDWMRIQEVSQARYQDIISPRHHQYSLQHWVIPQVARWVPTKFVSWEFVAIVARIYGYNQSVSSDVGALEH